MHSKDKCVDLTGVLTKSDRSHCNMFRHDPISSYFH